MDEDHLEYFKNLDNIIKSFEKFATLTSTTLIYNNSDPETVKSVENVNRKKITFGKTDESDYYPANIT